MSEIPVLKVVREEYARDRDSDKNHPLFVRLSEFLAKNGDSELALGWTEYYRFYEFFQKDPLHLEKFKGLHQEFDVIITFFEFLNKIQLQQEAVFHGQRSELFRFIKWTDDEDIPLDRLVRLFAAMESAAILNSANVMLLTKTRVWTLKNEERPTQTPVSFTFVDQTIRSEVQSIVQSRDVEGRCEHMQSSYNNLFEAGRYNPNFRF